MGKGLDASRGNGGLISRDWELERVEVVGRPVKTRHVLERRLYMVEL